MTTGQWLVEGLEALGLAREPARIERLLAFAEMLAKWNRVYNLTRIAPGESTITRHLLDSLAIAPLIHARAVVDVGSGGGLPGIPLAIYLPAIEFVLVDSAGKKARFLEQARIELALDNVRVVHARAEDVTGSFDIVTCRAFASLADIGRMTAHLLAPSGQIFALKGAVPAQEIAGIQSPVTLKTIRPLTVPGVDQPRNLVIMETQ